jgi:hypothetical protein
MRVAAANPFAIAEKFDPGAVDHNIDAVNAPPAMVAHIKRPPPSRQRSMTRHGELNLHQFDLCMDLGPTRLRCGEVGGAEGDLDGPCVADQPYVPVHGQTTSPDSAARMSAEMRR